VATFYPVTETERRRQQAQLAKYYSGNTPPHHHCVGPPSAASIAPASELQKRCRSVSRAPQLSATRHTSLRRCDLVAGPANH
ncbi:unnamed protein product, partial [Laminaria digitata]